MRVPGEHGQTARASTLLCGPPFTTCAVPDVGAWIWNTSRACRVTVWSVGMALTITRVDIARLFPWPLSFTSRKLVLDSRFQVRVLDAKMTFLCSRCWQ